MDDDLDVLEEKGELKGELQGSVPFHERMKGAVRPTPLEIADIQSASLRYLYQSEGENPVSLEVGYNRTLESKGREPYIRRYNIDESWQSIDTGWIDHKDVGFLLLINKSVPKYNLNPTEELKEQDAKVILEICIYEEGSILVPHLLVRPGHFFCCEVTDIEKIRVRSAFGELRLLLSLSPK